LQPNGFVYSAAIRACGLPEEVQGEIYTGTQSGSVAPALSILQIGAYAGIVVFTWGSSVSMLELLRDMLQRHLEPDAICYSAVASACVKCNSWAPALSLLCAAIAHQGLGLVPANAMLGALEIPGLWEASCRLLQEMQTSFVLPDVISYSVAISACERTAEWCTALELLRSMEQQSVSSNIIACTSAISACASGGAWQQALGLFAALPGRSLSANLVTYGTTISACARAVQWQRAVTLMEQFYEWPRVQQASSTMLNAVIYACARGAQWRPALAWLRQMSDEELQPDVISFNSCILAFEDVLSEDDARFGIVQELVDEKLALGLTAPRRLRRKPYASNDFFQLIGPLIAEGLRGLSLRHFLRACARPLQRSFRASRLKATSSLLARLGDDGWQVSPLPWLADGFLAQGATAVGGSPPHVTGEVYFQEATSMLPAEVLLLSLECFTQTSGRRTMTGLLLLDLCAAPGSKSTQLAAGLQGGALVANEPDFRRAEILHRNLLRSGSGSQVAVSCADGREVGQVFPEAFDGVLVDAPCSCEGTVRKEILRLLRCDAKESRALTEIQLSLLHSGWRALKPGGCLVYSTCTFNPNENEKVCSQFLKDVGHAAIPVEILSLLELPSAVGPHFHVLSKGGGGLGAVRLLPHSFNVEGFFICCFRKSADHPTAAGAVLRTSEFASSRFRRRPWSF
ncbi:rsmF, partial [Symbiodinium sp. CCMP2456]